MNDKPKKIKGKKKSLVPAVRQEGRLVPLDPFAAYMQEVKKYPLLSEDDEKELAIRLQETGDVDAAYQLTTCLDCRARILSNLRPLSGRLKTLQLPLRRREK